MINRGILTKIKNVQNTQKITRAMQMVSVAKMHKTQEHINMARPYADKVRTVMAHLSMTNTDIVLPFLKPHASVLRAGIILVTSDKGLCGGLNINLIKRFLHKVHELSTSHITTEACCLGLKGLIACKKAHIDVIASAVELGDTPQMDNLIGPVSHILQRYEEQSIDAIYVLYSRFINSMKQIPVLEQIVPLTRDHMKISRGYAIDYLYEPDAQAVLQWLVKRYIESVIYQAVADNMASEQAARMVAMKAATDNADHILKELRLIYNKSRQAAITTELSEIMAGAAAV